MTKAREKTEATFRCPLICPSNIFLKKEKEVLEFPVEKVYDKIKAIHLLIHMGWTKSSYCDPWRSE